MRRKQKPYVSRLTIDVTTDWFSGSSLGGGRPPVTIELSNTSADRPAQPIVSVLPKVYRKALRAWLDQEEGR